MSCYRIQNYACTAAGTYMTVVPHDTCLKIGKGLIATPIVDNGSIPRYHFNFCDYNKLQPKCRKTELLTG
jgi:hypothetical protein